MMIGNEDLTHKPTAMRMLCGHLAIGAIEVDDQSRSRIRAPISPPPSRKLLLDRVLRLTLAGLERSRTVCLRSVAFVRRRFAGDCGDSAMVIHSSC